MDYYSCSNTHKSDVSDKVIKQTVNYSLPTLIGNWEAAQGMQEGQMAVIQYKKAHNKLLSIRTRTMLRNLLAEVALSPCTEGIEYDKVYQICAPNLLSNIKEEYPYKNKGLYLSALLTVGDIDHGLDLMDGCLISASEDSTPSRRNTFIFVSDMKNSNNIYYGDDLFIQINSGYDIPLYLLAESNTMDNFGDSLTLRLSEQRNVYTHFRILNAHPKYRKDTQGMTIIPFTNVIIQHVASGRNLAAEINNWMNTFFGVECMATCHTFKNSNRIETAENMWQIIGLNENVKFVSSSLS